MNWDDRQNELEADRDYLQETSKLHQPGSGAQPKDFAAFHDLAIRHREAAERCRLFYEQRLRTDPMWKPLIDSRLI